MNKGADYSIKRGTGRKINLDEAKEILLKAEEAGLVHMTGNRSSIGTVICNCCSCCCIALSYEKNAVAGSLYGQVNPSRYRSFVDQDVCTGCGLCIDECPMENIVLNASNQAEAGAACLGCGICTHVCPEDALHLRLIREADHIPD
jgi:ferredoxin